MTDFGNYDAALADLNRAIQLDPTYALAYNNRGQTYVHLGKYREAIADWQQAADLYRQQGSEADYQRLIQAIEQLP